MKPIKNVLLSLSVLFCVNSYACHLSESTLKEFIDNGDGTYTFTINTCLAIETSINDGIVHSFIITPAGGSFGQIVNLQTNNFITSYNYCSEGCSSGNCNGTLLTGGGNGIGAIINSGADISFTGSGNIGEWLGPPPSMAGTCGNNPSNTCQDITFTTMGFPSTITITGLEGGNCTSEITDIPQPPTVINSCAGKFYDSGGSSSNYTDNENSITSYCSDNGAPIQIQFSSFSLESETNCEYDKLVIYDGSNVSAPIIGIYCGTDGPGTIIATGQCLTFEFISDDIINKAGWEANISCPCETPDISAIISNETCIGTNNGSIDLSISGGNAPYITNWSNGSTNEDISELSPGNFTVTVSGTNGCARDTTFTISSGTDLSADFNVTGPSCDGLTVNVEYSGISQQNCGMNCQTFSWDFGDGDIISGSGQSMVNLNHTYPDSGNYTIKLVVSDSNCSNANTANVSTTSGLSISYEKTDETCDGYNDASINLTINGSSELFSYLWSNGATTEDLSNIGDGVYYVIATSSDSCSLKDTIVINTLKPLPPSPDPYSNPSTCEGDTLMLYSQLIPNASYSWSGPNGYASFFQNPAIENADTSLSGLYIVTAEVNGCSNKDTISIIINTKPLKPVIYANSSICTGDTLILQTLFMPSYNYLWEGPSAFSSTNSLQIITNIDSSFDGWYYLSSSVNGCVSDKDSIKINIKPLPPFPNPSNSGPVCEGTPLLLFANSVSTAIYSWDGPNGFISNNQNLIISNPEMSHNGIFELTTTLDGCSRIDSTIVTILERPQLSGLESNAPVCENDSLLLKVDSISQALLFWTGPNGFNSSDFNPYKIGCTFSDSGMYYLVSIGLNGCISEPDSIYIEVNSIPDTPQISALNEYCEDDTVVLSSIDNFNGTVEWISPNNINSNEPDLIIPNIQLNQSGTYYLSTSVSGCKSAYDSIQISVNPVPVASFTFSPEYNIYPGTPISFFNNSIGYDSSYWIFNYVDTIFNQNPQYIFSESIQSGAVGLIVENQYNCTDTSYSEVDILSDFVFYIPSAFTPNNDGLNDELIIKGNNIDSEYFNMRIYDQWGEMIYESADYEKGWNGRYGNSIAQDGIYVWEVKLKEIGQDRIIKKIGHVSLLR